MSELNTTAQVSLDGELEVKARTEIHNLINQLVYNQQDVTISVGTDIAAVLNSEINVDAKIVVEIISDPSLGRLEIRMNEA